MSGAITMTPCESSNVDAWGYENGTLAVRFKSGGVYHYEGVPAESIDQLRMPETSVGAFVSGIRQQFNGVKQEPAVDDE
jgi:hypothetical protein